MYLEGSGNTKEKTWAETSKKTGRNPSTGTEEEEYHSKSNRCKEKIGGKKERVKVNQR